MHTFLILLGALFLGFAGAAVAELAGLDLAGEGRVVLGGALGIAGAVIAARLLRRED